jgi:hypothetical protein
MIASSALSGRDKAAALELSLWQKRDKAQKHQSISTTKINCIFALRRDGRQAQSMLERF